MNETRYYTCCCAMAGTSACDYCGRPSNMTWKTTTTTTIPLDIEDEDIKTILKKYLKKVLDD